MKLSTQKMLLIAVLFSSVVVNTIASLSNWTLCKKLLDSTNWKASSSAQYLFQYDNITFKECCYHCLDLQSCQTVFLHHGTCYGKKDLMADASKFSEVRVFVKQPIDVCINDEFLYYNEMCLHFGKISMTWPDAQTYCQAKGGRLIVLDSEIKHNNVTIFLNAYYQFTNADFFVGASDIDAEGSWKWVDGNANNYFNFKSDQPNNSDSDYGTTTANCGAYDITIGLLVDEYCLQTKPFICEI